MPTQHLVRKYLRLRVELALAFAVEEWKSCRLGHIERVSRELAAVENALEAQGIDDNLYVALVAGHLG